MVLEREDQHLAFPDGLALEALHDVLAAQQLGRDAVGRHDRLLEVTDRLHVVTIRSTADGRRDRIDGGLGTALSLCSTRFPSSRLYQPPWFAAFAAGESSEPPMMLAELLCGGRGFKPRPPGCGAA